MAIGPDDEAYDDRDDGELDHALAEVGQRAGREHLLEAALQPDVGELGADLLGGDDDAGLDGAGGEPGRSEEHTSELQSLMRSSYAVFCLKKKKQNTPTTIQQLMISTTTNKT